MSSHREAPEISKDPVADNTDIYAFVSPDRPDTVTIITNYIPLEDPAGGPNFFEFGDDVLYRINIDNNGDGKPTSSTSSSSRRRSRNPNTFLYNTGPIEPLDSPNFNRRQTYDGAPRSATGKRRACSAGTCRARRATSASARRRTTPALANAAIYDLGDGDQGVRRAAARRLLRRPRLGLRPRRAAPVPEPAPDPDAGGRRRERAAGVQRPHDRDPGADQASSPRTARRRTDPLAARRRDRRVGFGAPPQGDAPRRATGDDRRRAVHAGVAARQPAVQRGHRADRPQGRVEPRAAERDAEFAEYVEQPELAQAAAGPVPGRVPEPGRRSTADRADLVAILLTGIPPGSIPGFQNFTGRAGRPAAAQHGDPAGVAARTSTASSAATSPASRTAGGCSTTS